MTEIVVSKRDGIATEPNGTKHRVARGKTLADARHPLVVAYPGDWLPMEVALSMPDGVPAGAPSHAELLRRDNDDIARLGDELAEAEGAAEGYRKQLSAVVDVLAKHDLVPADAGARDGWLAEAVEAALAKQREGLAPGELPVDEPLPATVAPPKPPRAAKRAAPRADG